MSETPTQSFPGMDRSAPVTKRQIELLSAYQVPVPETRGEASDAIQAHESAHPELAEARKARAQEKRRQTLAARKAAAPVSEDEVDATPKGGTPVLDAYALASQQKAEKTGKPAASRNQLREVMRLAHQKPSRDGTRINALTALKGGVLARHASVLIAKLNGTFLERAVPAGA